MEQKFIYKDPHTGETQPVRFLNTENKKLTFAEIIKALDKIMLNEVINDQKSLRSFISLADKLRDFIKD